MKLNPALLALAIGAFGIGVTEFSPMGMLPVMATDLGVSIPTAGLLVSAYAVGVMLGAPLMTLTTTKLPRRTLLIGLMAIFTLGNFLSAIATDYTSLLIARIITSLNHGAFFGVGSVVAASVVAPDKKAGAVAAMFTGLTIATIGGVPLAALVGEVAGWRTAFWGVTALGVIAMIALRFALPNIPADKDVDVKSEINVLKRGSVLFALALTVIGSSAMFTVFTYIAPILQSEAKASSLFITAMLVIYGVGLTVGNMLGGRFADKSVDKTLIASLGGLIGLLVIFAFAMQWPVVAPLVIFLWGVASFAIVPPLQMRVMQEASDAPNLASAMNIGAFNLGNAVGAALGGAVISHGLGYPAVSLAGAAMSAIGLVMVLMARRSAKEEASRPKVAVMGH